MMIWMIVSHKFMQLCFQKDFKLSFIIFFIRQTTNAARFERNKNMRSKVLCVVHRNRNICKLSEMALGDFQTTSSNRNFLGALKFNNPSTRKNNENRLQTQRLRAQSKAAKSRFTLGKNGVGGAKTCGAKARSLIIGCITMEQRKLYSRAYSNWQPSHIATPLYVVRFFFR